MSALAITLISLGTVGAIVGAELTMHPLFGPKECPFIFSAGSFGGGTPESIAAEKAACDAAMKKQHIETGILLLGVVAVGLIAYGTSHTDIGKGVLFGAGGVAAVVAYDHLTKTQAK